MTDATRAPGTPSVALHPDVSTMLLELGDQVRHVESVSTLAGEDGRTCHKIAVASGRRFKARQLKTSEQARQVFELLAELDRPWLPRAIAWRGACLLEPWIEGEKLNAADSDFERCGAMLGSLHSASLRTCSRIRAPTDDRQYRPTNRQRQRFNEDLAVLSSRGAISQNEVLRLQALAQAACPWNAAIGYFHGDFCAENILRDAAGDLMVIDNETLSIGPMHFDLARTWYRWPMNVSQRRRFLAGYRRHCRDDRLVPQLAFWIIRVLASSAAFRLRTNADAQIPLGRFQALLSGGAAIDPAALIDDWDAPPGVGASET